MKFQTLYSRNSSQIFEVFHSPIRQLVLPLHRKRIQHQFAITLINTSDQERTVEWQYCCSMGDEYSQTSSAVSLMKTYCFKEQNFLEYRGQVEKI